MYKLRHLLIMLSLCCLCQTSTAEESVIPPQDPRQSINYWQSHRVNPQDDLDVAQALIVFNTLLRAWDDTRLAPSLTVVKSSAGPWAASLADGNILLSRDAIKIVKRLGKERSRHLLAFVLAHELAHQRADDLWHQRFFRLTDIQAPSDMQQAVKDSLNSANSVLDVQQQEAQADHDALILMSSVGYDPFLIVDRQDFFTQWVESIWQTPCASITDSASSLAKRACSEAQDRALRTRAQLSTVASQATLYELGVQAYIAGHYTDAQHYFTAYGREYPSRAVYTALSLTHLARAMDIYGQLSRADAKTYIPFHFPLLLDASPIEPVIAKGSNKRGDLKALRGELQRHTGEAIEYLDKAKRLNPEYRYSQLLIATCYILEQNTFMARGILQGKYLPQFGSDPESLLLLAIVSAMEHKTTEAESTIAALIKTSETPRFKTPALPRNLYLYSLYRNSAVLASMSGNSSLSQQRWMALAKRAKSDGDSILFRLAVTQLNRQPDMAATRLSVAPVVDQQRLGDHFSPGPDTTTKQTAIWLDGEQFTVLRLANGARFVIDQQQAIIGAWQSEGAGNLNGLLAGDSADRPFKLLGIPSRQLQLSSGQYLAYDEFGVAVQIVDEHVKGWFLYNTGN